MNQPDTRAVIGTPRDRIAAAMADAIDALRKFNAVVAEMKVRVALNERAASSARRLPRL